MENNNGIVLPELNKVAQLLPNVVRILGANPGPFTLQGTNSYLIGNGPEKLLIDTSEPNKQDYISTLKTFLQETNSSITDILVSHYHFDHAGSAKDVQQMCLSLRGKQPNIHKFPTKSTRVTVPLLDALPLVDGQIFTVDESTTLKVVFTPGHTDDHAAFLLVEGMVLFSGDCILGHGSTYFENMSNYLKSLECLSNRCNEFTVIYPGHGDIIKNPVDKISEYINHRKMRVNEVFEILKNDSSSGLTLEELFSKIYGSIPDKKRAAAGHVLQQSLDYLIGQKSIHKIDDNGVHKYCYKS